MSHVHKVFHRNVDGPRPTGKGAMIPQQDELLGAECGDTVVLHDDGATYSEVEQVVTDEHGALVVVVKYSD